MLKQSRRFTAWLIPLTMVGCVLIGIVQLSGSPQQSRKNPSLDPFMRLKLEHSKGILEGLATEDFEMIAKGAQNLTALSLESSWNVYTTDEYLKKSSDFRRSIQMIKDAAHEENVDRASLGYINLTVQCIECHRYLRVKADSDKAGTKPSDK
jgi:hypothetical protein